LPFSAGHEQVEQDRAPHVLSHHTKLARPAADELRRDRSVDWEYPDEMTLAGEGRDPGRSHMLRLAEQAGVSVSEAESIIGEVRDAVVQWGDFAEQARVSAATRNQIAGSLSGRGM
jgi:hypothetical protein